jgi:hypothetical protein
MNKKKYHNLLDHGSASLWRLAITLPIAKIAKMVIVEALRKEKGSSTQAGPRMF